MNIDQMTIDQIRDYIAECKGWRYKYGKHQCLWVLGDFPNGAGSKSSPVHPVPDTLDAAAEALPYNWRWEEVVFLSDHCCVTAAPGMDSDKRRISGIGHYADANTRPNRMKRGMFRAAARVWQHQKMAAKTTITIDPEKVTKESIEALMKDNGVVEQFREVASWPEKDQQAISNTKDGECVPVSNNYLRVDDSFKCAYYGNTHTPDCPVSQTWTLP